MKTTFRLERRGNETWRECVDRYSTLHHLHNECLSMFDSLIDRSVDEGEAAWEALYEWDLIPVVEVPEEGDV